MKLTLNGGNIKGLSETSKCSKFPSFIRDFGKWHIWLLWQVKVLRFSKFLISNKENEDVYYFLNSRNEKIVNNRPWGIFEIMLCSTFKILSDLTWVRADISIISFDERS